MGSSEQGWKRYFLSDTIRYLEVFKSLRRNDCCSSETLFIHPHSETVRLTSFPPDAIRPDQAEVPIDEALHLLQNVDHEAPPSCVQGCSHHN